MEEIDDGGPAFPCDSKYQLHPGMTLRDWFAGQLLTNERIGNNIAEPDLVKAYAVLARRAYAVADAMLFARTAHLKGAPDAT